MKKYFTSVLVILLTVCIMPLFAHEHHDKDVHKDSVANSNVEMSNDSDMVHEMKAHEEMKAVNAFPNYHPLIVHFPIVLLIIVTFMQLFSFFVYKNELSWISLVLLTVGVITTWLSSNTFHADPDTLTGRAKEIFDTHEQMANLTWWFAVTALIGKIISHLIPKVKTWLEIIILLFLIASATSVSIAGHHGAMLVHMEGIGPKGNHLESHEHHNEE